MKNWRKKLKLCLLPGLIYIFVYCINRTIRLKVSGEENLEKTNLNKPLLYAFWHGMMWIPIYFFRRRNYVTLASMSSDGEYITRALERFGWQVVRGSSTRGGSRSLIQLYKKLKKGIPAVITPDGPTGPIHKVKPGIVFLAEKSEGKIIPVGIAVKNKKVFNSWDKFVLPLPWTPAVIKLGEPVNLPESLSVEARCKLVEEKIDEVQKAAEKELANY